MRNTDGGNQKSWDQERMDRLLGKLRQLQAWSLWEGQPVTVCMVSMNLGKCVPASASKCAFEGGTSRGAATVSDSPRSGTLP